VRKKSDNEFQLIAGTNGQVWFLNEIDGTLFCGHDNGTYVINGASATKISDRLGTWIIKEYNDTTLVQGHYDGLSFLRKDRTGYEALPMLPDFPHSSKSIEITRDQKIWVGNEHKGVFKLDVNENLDSIKELTNFKFDQESGITSGIFQFNDSLYYSNLKNIYRYDPAQKMFDTLHTINHLIQKKNRVSGKMVVNNNETLWGFSREGIFVIKPERIRKGYSLEQIFIDQEYRNIAVGYENIRKLPNERYLLGVANGYITFNQENEQKFGDFEIHLSHITASSLDSKEVSINPTEEVLLPYRQNHLKFEFSTPAFKKFVNTQYSYRLYGLSNRWSKWQERPVASYENLDYGDYEFEVKARLGNTQTQPVKFAFSIQRPYYLSIWAFILYALIFLFVLYAIHLMNKKHHRKHLAANERTLKLKNLQAEKEIIKLQNEKLEQEMAGKNRELAVTTMSLIKKNEFLTRVKEQLQEYKNTNNVKTVIQTIDQDISEEDNWKFFKKAFSNADKDFFRKIKNKHPELTSNDLKLCAYLRLNLSSKEIAPLLAYILVDGLDNSFNIICILIFLKLFLYGTLIKLYMTSTLL